MNKNRESFSSAIERHRKRARYKRLLKAQKGRVDTCFESDKISTTKKHIFDEPIQNDATPVLQPTPWRLLNIALKNKQNIKNFAAKHMQKTKNFFTMGMQKIKDFGEWLLNYIPPKSKVVDKVLESFKNKMKKICEKRASLFQPTHTISDLKNFAI